MNESKKTRFSSKEDQFKRPYSKIYERHGILHISELAERLGLNSVDELIAKKEELEKISCGHFRKWTKEVDPEGYEWSYIERNTFACYK